MHTLQLKGYSLESHWPFSLAWNNLNPSYIRPPSFTRQIDDILLLQVHNRAVVFTWNWVQWDWKFMNANSRVIVRPCNPNRVSQCRRKVLGFRATDWCQCAWSWTAPRQMGTILTMQNGKRSLPMIADLKHHGTKSGCLMIEIYIYISIHIIVKFDIVQYPFMHPQWLHLWSERNRGYHTITGSIRGSVRSLLQDMKIRAKSAQPPEVVVCVFF